MADAMQVCCVTPVPQELLPKKAAAHWRAGNFEVGQLVQQALGTPLGDSVCAGSGRDFRA